MAQMTYSLHIERACAGKQASKRCAQSATLLLILALSCGRSSSAQGAISEKQDFLPDAPSAQSVAAGAPVGASGDPLTLKKLPLRFLSDEAAIFTSPARIRKSDLKWLAPLAGATAASLSTDTYTMRNVVSRDSGFNNAANTTSDVLLGAAAGAPVLMFLGGQFTHNEHAREAGLLGGEALIDALAFDTVIKFATLRERPLKNNARGHFYVGDSASDPSFVSGHSILTWSSAAVLADEYTRPWQRIGIYTLASGVSISRVLAQQHFPTDTLLGAASGWLIGHYVFQKHHRFPAFSSLHLPNRDRPESTCQVAARRRALGADAQAMLSAAEPTQAGHRQHAE